MKKLLSTTLALAMGATCAVGLVGCGENKEIAQKAVDALKVMYAEKDVEAVSNYTVVGQTKVDGETYSIKWKVESATVNNIEDYVKVGEMDETTKLVTIGITTTDKEMDYTLKGTVKVGGKKASVTLERKVARVYSSAQANALAATVESGKYYEESGAVKAIFVKGYVVDAGYYDTGYQNFNKIYIADEYSADKTKESEGAFYVYRVKPDTTYLKADGDIDTGDLAIFKGYLQNYNGTYELTYYTTENVYCVYLERATKTDEEKVASAKTAVKLETTSFNSVKSVDLPLECKGATLSWALKTQTDLVTVANGKLNIVKLPNAATEVVLTVTITVGDKSDTLDVTITVEPAVTITHAGTQADPFTTAEALAIAKDLESGAYYSKDGTDTKVYVTGYVVANSGFSSDYNNWTGMYIAGSADGNSGSDDALLVFRFSTDDTFIKAQEDLVVGSKITVFGYLQNYKGNSPQMTYKDKDNPVAVAYEKAQITPSNDVTLAFTKANRTEFETRKQTFSANGITFTNTEIPNDLQDSYVEPVRLYKDSKVKIEYTGNINVLVFNVGTYSTNDYVTPLMNSLASLTGATATKNGKVVTVTFASPVTTVEFTCTAQIRLDSIVVK